MKWCIRLILLSASILCTRHYFQKDEQVSAFQEEYRQKTEELSTYPELFIQKQSYTLKSSPGQYNQSVYILQGPYTGSAGSSFCLMTRLGYANVRLAGEPFKDLHPGTGNILPLSLPNTHIPFSIATHMTCYEHHLSEKNGRIQPDLPFFFQSEDSVSIEEMQKIILIHTE